MWWVLQVVGGVQRRRARDATYRRADTHGFVHRALDTLNPNAHRVIMLKGEARSMAIHIIHDTDRDGWGSASMLLAQFGSDSCVLHPHPGKDVTDALNELEVHLDDRIYVLDIPASPSWERHQRPPCPLIWVDHHATSWEGEAPEWLDVRLPANTKPTVTMAMLLRERIVTTPRVMTYVHSLIRDEGDWGALFDALATPEEAGIDVVRLGELLALGPLGEPVPPELRPLLERSADQDSTVRKVLASAEKTVTGRLVRVDLSDARGVRLAKYSLALQKQHLGCVVVIVHRRRRLYVGQASDAMIIDLIEYFRGRGLQPKGHSYVCVVELPAEDIENEVEALTAAVEAPVSDA